MDYKHCCYNMDWYATNRNSLIHYDKDYRSYHFYLYNSRNGTHQAMYYCPWCGTEIPKDLSDIWTEILEKEYDIEEPYLNRDKIPPEFKTDEWWKKRGL